MNDRNELSAEELMEFVHEEQWSVSDEARSEAVERQHEEGKLTARERIEYLIDDGSFEEIGRLASPEPTTPETYNWTREDAPADGVVSGIAEIKERPVAVGASDFTVMGGSVGHIGHVKLERLGELALRNGYPMVLLHDGGGHRIQDGLDARTYARTEMGLFGLMQQMSGWIPIVSAMMGPAFAAPTNFAGLSDFVPMVDGNSTLGVAGPSLVKEALGIDLPMEELGGAEFQTAETGMADIACDNDEDCLDAIIRYLSYFPSNAKKRPPITDESLPPKREAKENLIKVIPTNRKKGYDIYAIIEGIFDRESLFETKPRFARNLITAFARVDGQPVGIVCNNPKIKAGTIDAAASTKGARFISLCDAFGLPIVWLIDCPGVLPGPDSEREGVARRSGKLIYEIARATVPTVSVVLRRGYGFGYVVMGGGRAGDSELSVAWPTAEISAMSIGGAVNIAYQREIKASDDPETKREELVRKFSNRTGSVRAAEGMGIDSVIDPSETRDHITTVLERTQERETEQWPPKKHSINPW